MCGMGVAAQQRPRLARAPPLCVHPGPDPTEKNFTKNKNTNNEIQPAFLGWPTSRPWRDLRVESTMQRACRWVWDGCRALLGGQTRDTAQEPRRPPL